MPPFFHVLKNTRYALLILVELFLSGPPNHNAHIIEYFKYLFIKLILS